MPMPEMMGAIDPKEDSMDSMDNPDSGSTDEKDRPRLFASKDALPPGFKPEKGKSLRAEVEDVDPETGEAQICLYADGEGDSSDKGGYAEAFDKAMPEEG